MSFGGAYTSSGVIPGIQVALDQINSRQDILPGYTLHYTLQDSQVCVYALGFDIIHFYKLYTYYMSQSVIWRNISLEQANLFSRARDE